MNNYNRWFKELDNFVMVPKALFENPRYFNIGTDEMLIYSLMVERMNLSAQNESFYYSGTGVFIYYPLSEIQSVLRCSNKKARNVMQNLTEAGLIIKSNQGQGKPAKIVPLRYRDTAEISPCINN